VSRERKITDVYIWQNGMVMTFDQFGEQMPEYQGRREEVLDKIRAVYDGPIACNCVWPRPGALTRDTGTGGEQP
jgi:hypothetical protein